MKTNITKAFFFKEIGHSKPCATRLFVADRIIQLSKSVRDIWQTLNGNRPRKQWSIKWESTHTDNEETVIKLVSIENATFYMRTAPPCDHWLLMHWKISLSLKHLYTHTHTHWVNQYRWHFTSSWEEKQMLPSVNAEMCIQKHICTFKIIQFKPQSFQSDSCKSP